MKNITITRGFTLSRGLTLIELMITLVLSLMITYAIAQVLISSNRTSVTSDGMSQSQETGRFVMSFLANNIRSAGLDSITNDNVTTAAIISCEDPAMAGLMDFEVAGNHQCSFESDLGGDPTVNTGDRLAIAWVPPLPAGGEALIRDCSGTGGYAEDEIILNVFWVEFDANNNMNNLVCRGHAFDGTNIIRSNDAQAIANGVESLHVLYGEGVQPLPVNSNRNVGRYVHGGAIAAGGVNDWDRVYAIKVSIMTRSLTAVTNALALRRYVLLDAQPYEINDAVSRQVFTTTFAINNYN